MSAVDEYLERSATKSQKIHLEHIRQVVRALVPEAEERISYGLPTFTYQGRPLLHYGAFKNHMSIFPTAAPLAALQSKLRQYTTSKGTIQFTEGNPVSDETTACASTATETGHRYTWLGRTWNGAATIPPKRT